MVKPQDIPTVGRFAVLTDPQGAYVSAFTPAYETPDEDPDPAPGQFSWHELATTDAAAALAFYSQLFGWKESSAFDMGGGWMYHMYGRGDRDLGGIFTKPAEMPGPPAWCCCPWNTRNCLTRWHSDASITTGEYSWIPEWRGETRNSLLSTFRLLTPVFSRMSFPRCAGMVSIRST